MDIRVSVGLSLRRDRNLSLFPSVPQLRQAQAGFFIHWRVSGVPRFTYGSMRWVWLESRLSHNIWAENAGTKPAKGQTLDRF
jgi:hypothetical protein